MSGVQGQRCNLNRFVSEELLKCNIKKLKKFPMFTMKQCSWNCVLS